MTDATDDVINSKIDKVFQTMDVDQNGYLEWSDYESLLERYLTACNLDRSDRRARAITAFYRMYWLELLRHSEVDGDRLTKEQYITANRLASSDTRIDNDGSSNAIFDCIDGDGDDEISKAEFERFLWDVWRITAPEARETFARLDTDGDGSISRQEFILSSRNFHSSDADTAGGSLYFVHV